MPRYDYECDTCHHRFELRQSFDSEPVAPCPNCENESRRKFHAVPVVFKGSGWYVNDYGKRSSSSTGVGNNSKSESASEKSESSSTKSESKSETKSAVKADSSTSSSSKDK